MASIINAATSGGLITTADTSGILQLQTAGTTAVTVDASQRAAFVAGTAALPAITTTGDTNTGIFFPAADTIAFAEGGTEAARFDSAGSLLVGQTTSVTSGRGVTINTSQQGVISRSGVADYNEVGVWTGTADTVKAQVQANQAGSVLFGARTNHPVLFTTNDTERARIDSSGNLLVGDTSAAGRVLAKSATSDGTTSAYVAKNSSGTILLDIISTGYFKTGVAGNSPYNNATGSGANVFVGSDGALFRSTSSLKYKTDIQDATFGIADVLKLRAVTYKGKGSSDGDKVFAGLIAEEVHNLGLTQFVQYADDGSPDALSYGNMVSLCVKAIQEQQALITQLQADVAALKGA